MSRLTSEKLAQAAALVAEADLDAWITFARETVEGGDPILPLLLEAGLTWHSALIVARDGRKVAVLGNYDADPLRASGDWDEVIPYVEGIGQPLRDALERMVPPGARPPRLGVNWSEDDPKSDGLTHGMYRTLGAILRETRFAEALVSAEPVTSRLRSRKTAEEVRRMRAAIDVTEELLAALPSVGLPGKSEREIYAHLQQEVERRGLGFSWDRANDPIVNSGPDSSIGHGLPSGTIRVAPGHMVHVDFGVLVEGYASDLQRCWFVADGPEAGGGSAARRAPSTSAAAGALPPDVQRAFAAVHGAISAGSAALKPGVPAWTVDAAARAHLEAAGYPEYLHALGHQVGRMAHDGGAVLGPRWERYGRLPYLLVEEGQVFTLELGVVVDGRGYLGLEEMVQVTASGCDWLSRRQSSLPVIT